MTRTFAFLFQVESSMTANHGRRRPLAKIACPGHFLKEFVFYAFLTFSACGMETGLTKSASLPVYDVRSREYGVDFRIMGIPSDYMRIDIPVDHVLRIAHDRQLHLLSENAPFLLLPYQISWTHEELQMRDRLAGRATTHASPSPVAKTWWS